MGAGMTCMIEARSAHRSLGIGGFELLPLHEPRAGDLEELSHRDAIGLVEHIRDRVVLFSVVAWLAPVTVCGLLLVLLGLPDFVLGEV